MSDYNQIILQVGYNEKGNVDNQQEDRIQKIACDNFRKKLGSNLREISIFEETKESELAISHKVENIKQSKWVPEKLKRLANMDIYLKRWMLRLLKELEELHNEQKI